MCNKLLQLYACSHAKEICTTPCPHAQTIAIAADVSRSNSVASSIAPTSSPSSSASSSSSPSSSARKTTVYTSPMQRSPLRVMNPDHDDTATETPGTMFRPHNTPHQQAVHDAHGRAQTQSSTAPHHYISSATPSSCTSPTSKRSSAGYAPAPHLCAYQFPPRFLPPSRYPCLDCYMLPRWEGVRRAWVESYRNGHPMDGEGNAERLSGVGGVRVRNGGRRGREREL